MPILCVCKSVYSLFKSLLLPQLLSELHETWLMASWGWLSTTNGAGILNFSLGPPFWGKKCVFRYFAFPPSIFIQTSRNSMHAFLTMVPTIKRSKICEFLTWGHFWGKNVVFGCIFQILSPPRVFDVTRQNLVYWLISRFPTTKWSRIFDILTWEDFLVKSQKMAIFSSPGRSPREHLT